MPVQHPHLHDTPPCKYEHSTHSWVAQDMLNDVLWNPGPHKNRSIQFVCVPFVYWKMVAYQNVTPVRVCNVTQKYRTVVHLCTGSIPRALWVSLAHYGAFEPFGRFVNRVTLSERIGTVPNHLKTKGVFTLSEIEYESETCICSLSLSIKFLKLRNHLKATSLTLWLSFNVNMP